MTGSTNYFTKLSVEDCGLLCSYYVTREVECRMAGDPHGAWQCRKRADEIRRKTEAKNWIALDRDEAELFPKLDIRYAWAA